MTNAEFDETSFYNRMPVMWNGKLAHVAGVDFDKREIYLDRNPKDPTLYWVDCSFITIIK